MEIPESLAKRIIAIADELKEKLNPTEDKAIYDKKTISGVPYPKACKQIIEYLNKETGKNFKSETAKTRKLLYSRFNDGFSLVNFKNVIDTKVSQWKGDMDYQIYLRPSTLFGSKFEGYVNEKIIEAPESPEEKVKRKNFY